jgi:hypothetical protein
MAKILKVGLGGQEGSEEEYLSKSSDPSEPLSTLKF